MIRSALNIVKTAAAFLQNGVVPPNTCPTQHEEMKNKNHLASKKFFLAFSGFIILGIFYVASVGVMFLMKDHTEMLHTFPTIFAKTIEVFAAIMAVYLGGQALIDLKYGSTSSASTEYKREDITYTEKVVGNEKEEDYTLDIDDYGPR